MKIDAKKAAAAIQAIHDLLYLDYRAGQMDDHEFYNGSKEWDEEKIEHVARIVEKVIPRPPEYEECDECGAMIPDGKGDDGGGLANKHHRDSCSLYDPKEE